MINKCTTKKAFKMATHEHNAEIVWTCKGNPCPDHKCGENRCYCPIPFDIDEAMARLQKQRNKEPFAFEKEYMIEYIEGQAI